MINIVVCRNAHSPIGCPLDDPGLNWGGDISDPLLTTTQAAKERGTIEIDKTYSDRLLCDLTLHQLDYFTPGTMSSFVNLNGEVKKGLSTQFSLSIQKTGQGNFTAQSSINLECSHD